nr:hypothetical protein [Mycolicibacterium sp. CBMA 213]
MPSSNLRRMRYLGWFHLPGGQKQQTPWITDDGDLDPEELLSSELFRGNDVEPITDSVAIPVSVQNASDLAAYLNAGGWDWPADDTDALTTPAWAARTASNAYFLLNRDGLLVHFAPYPTLDTGSGQWAGSPLWAGFLLICTNSINGKCRPFFPLTQNELWTAPLEYLSQQRPWLSIDAESTSKALTTDFAIADTQQRLNARARSHPVKILKKDD